MREEEGSISAEDYLEQTYGDFPRWAISLAGLRYREDLTQKQLGELIGVKQSNNKYDGKRFTPNWERYCQEACQDL